MANVNDVEVPGDNANETELFLSWLDYLRGAVIRNLSGLHTKDAHWHPDAGLISSIGIVNHLTHVEWRWIDGGVLGEPVDRSEAEFSPSLDLTAAQAIDAYLARGEKTNAVVRAQSSLDVACHRKEGTTLRWTLIQIMQETARHAGHGDATRELLDGTTGP